MRLGWFSALCALSHATDMKLSIAADHSYTISVGGNEWFQSGATAYTKGGKLLSTADGSLKESASVRGTGSDQFGSYKSTTIAYDSNNFVTEFKDYGDMIVFTQTFPNGVAGTTSSPDDPMSVRDDVSSSFPSFARSKNTETLGTLQFTGDMTGSNAKHGSFSDSFMPPTGVKGFGPTGIFDKSLNNSVVISSFSQFMAASAGPATDGVAYGAQASVKEFPKGFTLSFVIVASPNGGVNAAFENWGDKLLAAYGKSRELTYRDYSLQYLGYSTDNGAYYYYQTEDHPAGKRGPPYTPGKSYEDTLIDVKKYADSEGIPYKYVLLDSWWYYQGVGAGVVNWIGRPDIFPHGNSYLRNQTGWPIMGHNRYWAVDNVYCKQNGGDYDFIVEKKGDDAKGRFKNFAWPTEQRFWNDLMYNSSQWGLFMYEQDWLDTEYDNVVVLNTNASAARTWLMQMGSAATDNDLTIQYCMSHCRHIMQSLEIPAVTNARASGDYHAGGDQWSPLGLTGIFAWAVAIAPTKDNFWSTDEQTGSAYGYDDYKTIREPYNRLQSAVSTLSKGPVAPSDKIGRSDTALILKSCAADGRLLQGDKPAMAIDAQHAQSAFAAHATKARHCRITVKDGACALHESEGGYSAYVPATHASAGDSFLSGYSVDARKYTEHRGQYCDCNGNGSCSHWAYESEKIDLDACMAECDKRSCSCFDFVGDTSPETPAPAPTPASGPLGPDGQVWATTTTLGDSTRWGVVLAATLKADYTMALAEAGLTAGKYVSYEANSTGTISTSSSIALKACDKWDFQLWAVAPVLSSGWSLLGEPSKWVPVSNARFENLQTEVAAGVSSASVTAKGMEGEKISVAWLAPGASKPIVVDCVIPVGNAVTISVTSSDTTKGLCTAA